MPYSRELRTVWRSIGNTPSVLLFVLFCLLQNPQAGSIAVAEEMTATSLLTAYVEQVNDNHTDVTAALTVFKQGNFDQARQLLQKATVADPQLPPAGVLLTRMFLAAGQPVLASAELQRVTEQHPDDPEAFLGIGELSIAQNRPADARLAFDKASDLAKRKQLSKYRTQKMRYRMGMGLAALAEQQQDWATAIKHLQPIVDGQQHGSDVVVRLARSRFKLGEREPVFKLLQNQWHQSPRTMQLPELTMGLLCQEAGEQQQAAEWIRQAADTDQKSEATQSAVATWALENGDNDFAQTCAQQAADNSNGSIQSRLLLALVARYKKDYVTARQHLESVHLESPADLAAVIELSIVLSHIKGMENRALQYAQVGNKLQPDLKLPAGRNAAIATARILHRYGGEAEAEKIVRRVLKIGPVSVESSFYSAVILLKNDPATAKQLLRQLVDSQRIFPDYEAAKALLKNAAR